MKKRSLLRSTVALAVALMFFLMPSVSLGWGSGGHMMVAFIAFGRLNPNAKAEVKKLLAIRINPPDVTARSKDFVSAAHWADDVKFLPGFEATRDEHFIDIPFSTDRTKLPDDLPKPVNIVKALTNNVDVLKTSTDDNERAKALRFIIHYVGDIHQPLHCATNVDKDHLEGDQGGNFFFIKLPGKDGKLKNVKLHGYWDGGIGKFPKEGPGPKFTPPPLNQIPPAARTAMRGNPATDPDLNLDKPFEYQAWADESFKLAKSTAYKAKRGKQPTPAYNKAALKVARTRVAFAGYRLAALLNAIWP